MTLGLKIGAVLVVLCGAARVAQAQVPVNSKQTQVQGKPTPEDCKKLRLHGQRTQANACFETLASSTDGYLHAEGLWGIEEYSDANVAFRDALGANPNSVPIRVEWG